MRPSKQRPNPGPQTEDAHQIALFAWAANPAVLRSMPDLEKMYHVPNGGSRHPAEAGKLKAMGVKAGRPDVHLDVARGGYHGLRIEMKSPANPLTKSSAGELSEVQKRILLQLQGDGYRVDVCHGWEAAAKALTDYLSMETTP